MVVLVEVRDVKLVARAASAVAKVVGLVSDPVMIPSMASLRLYRR